MLRKKNFLIVTMLILLVFLVTACSGFLPKPTKGVISGRVLIPPTAKQLSKDISGWVGAAGAEVTIVDANGVKHTVITDENGYYNFENIAVKPNTVVTATVKVDGKTMVLKTVIEKAVGKDQKYDSGAMTPESTALALVVEKLIAEGKEQAGIDLGEVQGTESFSALVEQVETVIEEQGNVTEDPDVTEGVEDTAEEIITPPPPPSTPPSGPSAVPVSSVSIDQEDQTLVIGATLELTVTIEPANATNKNVTWETDNEDVATIDNYGVVTAVGKGDATITVTTVSGNKQDGIDISIEKPVYNINKGSGYDNIEAAISDAGDENEILVGVGDYGTNLVIDKEGLTLKSCVKHKAVIKTVAGFNAGGGYGGITVLADGVTIDGFKIEQGVAQAVIHTHNSQHVTIKDNYISSTANSRGIDVGYATAASNGVTVQDNEFEDLYCGVYVNQGTYLVVDGNEFTNMDGGAVVFEGTWNNIDDIEVKDNEATNAEYLLYFFNVVGSVTAIDNTLVNTEISNYGVYNETQNRYFPTIQAAIDETTAGDNILVGAGTYEEVMLIGKPLKLIGAGPDNTIIDMSKLTDKRYGIEIHSDNVKIEGFKIIGHQTFDADSAGIGHESGYYSGAASRNSPNKVKDIEIRDIFIETHHDGIKFRGAPDEPSENILIENVEVNNCIDTGLKFWNVKDSVIREAQSYGHLYHWNGEVRTDEGIALEVKSSDNITIEDVEVWNSQRGFLVWQGGTHVLRNVIARNMKDKLYNTNDNRNADGFKFDFYNGGENDITTVTLENAVSSENPVSGLRARNTGLTITGGIFAGNGTGEIRSGWDSNRAISLESHTWVNVQGVTFEDNPAAIVFDSDANVTDSKITGNIIRDNFLGIENKADASIDAIHNWWGDASGPRHESNPGGSGDSVSDNVEFEPWCTNEGCTE